MDRFQMGLRAHMQVCTRTLGRVCILDARREVPHHMADVHMIERGGNAY